MVARVLVKHLIAHITRDFGLTEKPKLFRGIEIECVSTGPYAWYDDLSLEADDDGFRRHYVLTLGRKSVTLNWGDSTRLNVPGRPEHHFFQIDEDRIELPEAWNCPPSHPKVREAYNKLFLDIMERLGRPVTRWNENLVPEYPF